MGGGRSVHLSLLGALCVLSAGVPLAVSVPAIAQTADSLPQGALIAPDGEHAVWPLENAGGFAIVERAGEGWSPPREIHIRGVVRTPAFSPDGRYLAFENLRGGYPTGNGPASSSYMWSYIAYYDLATGAIDYADPSLARDHTPVWRDSASLSFTRSISGQADTAITVRPGAEPPPLSAPQAAKKAELEALLAAPIVYQPSRSGDGRSIAFPAREGRTRSIFFASQGGTARALVRYSDDDGQEMSQVAVSQDGGLVAFVRGGAPNSKGEVPNPRSLATPPERQVLLVATDGNAAPVVVAGGFAPQFSPDGSMMVWRNEHSLMTAPLTSADGAARIGPGEPLLSGEVANVRFSPDGGRIAYERLSAIEVLDLETRGIWISPRPAGAKDRDPSWSRDGTRLAFRRVTSEAPTRLYGYAGPVIAPQPWSIQVAEGADYRLRQVWQADEGIGSEFYPLDQDASKTGLEWTQLFWSDSDEIAFVWERDGWRHLYAVPGAGGEARLLTPGEGEIESAAVSLDGKHLVYAGNFGDLDRRHIGSVTFAGGAPVKLATTDDASQWSPTTLADGAVAFVQGGWRETPHIAIRQSDGRTASVGGVRAPEGFPAERMVQPQPVSFPGTDGEMAFGQLFIPSEPNGCGVVFVHGGIRRQMLLGFHYIDVYSNLYELNQYFVMRGCVVLSVEYRSSIMRGYAFRNPENWGSGGASEYKDVLGGARYLQSRADLGVEKIGIYGLSWGGYLTAQAIARDSDTFAVGFDMAGVHEFLDDAFKYSPAAFAEGWRSPVMLVSGDDDRNVDMSQTMLLIDRLNHRAKTSELALHAYPNEVHDIYLTFDALSDAYWRGSEFMLEWLPPNP